MKKFFDLGSLFVILLTLILFVAALVEKGFTHDLLLEAGVFLVSLKLIMMSYKTNLATEELEERLDKILATLKAPTPAADSEVQVVSHG